MKHILYLDKKKIFLNRKDHNENTIYELIQCGPMEEENLVEFEIDIEKFRKYEAKVKRKKSST